MLLLKSLYVCSSLLCALCWRISIYLFWGREEEKPVGLFLVCGLVKELKQLQKSEGLSLINEGSWGWGSWDWEVALKSQLGTFLYQGGSTEPGAMWDDLVISCARTCMLVGLTHLIVKSQISKCWKWQCTAQLSAPAPALSVPSWSLLFWPCAKHRELGISKANFISFSSRYILQTDGRDIVYE